MLDMLAYALRHRQAVNSVTQDRALGLRKYELDDKEWDLLEQLHGVLKVCGRTNMFVVVWSTMLP